MKSFYWLFCILLSLCIFGNAQSTPNTLCRPDVQAAVSELQTLSGTLTNVERAIVAQDDGTLQRFQGAKDVAPFAYDAHSLLVLHNHPYNDTEPSAHDRKLATQINLPVYVVTRAELWVAMPDGRMFQADSFKTATYYTEDPEGPPSYGRQHFFTVSNIMGECVDTRLSTTVFLQGVR